jgi:hypothetical protein
MASRTSHVRISQQRGYADRHADEQRIAEIIPAGIGAVNGAKGTDAVHQTARRRPAAAPSENQLFQRLDDRRRFEDAAIDLLVKPAVAVDDADHGHVLKAARRGEER